jgi:hypothetical protein
VGNTLVDDRLRFQAEVDALVRRWANGDEREHWRRWRQLGNFRSTELRATSSRRRHSRSGSWEYRGRCADCGNTFEEAALQMHRLDQSHAHDRTLNFGYTEVNVVLLCAGCHERREAVRR